MTGYYALQKQTSKVSHHSSTSQCFFLVDGENPPRPLYGMEILGLLDPLVIVLLTLLLSLELTEQNGYCLLASFAR